MVQPDNGWHQGERKDKKQERKHCWMKKKMENFYPSIYVKWNKEKMQLTWSGGRQLKQTNNEEEEYDAMLFVHDPGFSCCFRRWWLQTVVAVGRTWAGRRRQEGINKRTKEATWASLFVNHNNYVKSRRPDRSTLTWIALWFQENAEIKLLQTKLTSLDLKFSRVLWDVALCNLVDRYQVSS